MKAASLCRSFEEGTTTTATATATTTTTTTTKPNTTITITPLKSCLKELNPCATINTTQAASGASASSVTAATLSRCDDNIDDNGGGDEDNNNNIIDNNIDYDDYDDDSGSPKRVFFDQIHIREYPQRLGDNPAVSDGAPVTLDWDYQNEYIVSVEVYEFTRNPVRRKGRKKLMLSPHKRVRTLIAAGHSIDEIGDAMMAVEKCQNERLRSAQAVGWNGPLTGAMEDSMVGALRTMRRRGTQMLKGSLHSAMEGLGKKRLQPKRKSYSNPAG